MVRKSAQFAYGFKLIATWMLIPFVVLVSALLIREFSHSFTSAEVTLGEEVHSSYPDEYHAFESDINGKTDYVHAPVTCKPGDTITVILRDGKYYKTPGDAEDLKACTTFGGRFMKAVDNNFGIHTVAIAAVLLVTFLLTIKKTKEVRKIYPKLSKITDIAGIVCSVIMSSLLIYAVIDNTLTSLGFAYLGLFLGMIYTAIFAIAWIVEFIIMIRLK